MQCLTGSTRGHADPAILGLSEKASVAYGISRRQGPEPHEFSLEEKDWWEPRPISTRDDAPEVRDALNRIYLMFDFQARE